MAYKKNMFCLHKYCTAILLCGSFMFSGFAQNGEQGQNSNNTYYIRETADGVSFVQNLSWDATPYAFGYDIVLEQQNTAGLWEYVDTYTTQNNNLQVSLFAGIYRYKILVYNLLNKPESESPWFDLVILKALQPILQDISPNLIYLDEEFSDIFYVEAENIDEEAIFTLGIPEFPEQTLFGDIIHIDQNQIEIYFDVENLVMGNYTFTVQNPGGLSDALTPIEIKYTKPFDIYASLGYSFAYLPPAGELTEYFNTDFLPLGFNAQVAVAFKMQNTGHSMGAMLGAHYFRLENAFDTYDIQANIIPIYLDFIYYIPLKKNLLTWNAHIGGGLTLLNNLKVHFKEDWDSTSLNLLGLTAHVGTGLYIHIKDFFVEVGADYMISLFNFSDIFQTVVPKVAVGWRF